MPIRDPIVRAARLEEALVVAYLQWVSSTDELTAWAGSSSAACELLAVAFRRRGNSASRETMLVAEFDARAAGALGGWPMYENGGRARRWAALSLRHLPPERWPALAREWRAPHPAAPPDAFYVDWLAVCQPFRRRGVARQLLDAAAARARAAGCRTVAVRVRADNGPALALYRSAGFEAYALAPASDEIVLARPC
jgi:ribosomal protein S18 acetylase RimI-like enzyme